MPLAVETINKNTPLETVRHKISLTIEYLVKNEGKTQDEARGQAYGMAEKQWGRKIPTGN